MQNFLYQHQQKHYKREYIAVIDEEGNESSELVTKAMRAYSLGLQSVDKSELFQELEAVLDERESAILWSMYDTKQVKENYYSNGEKKERYKTKFKTLVEIASETGYTIKQIRASKKEIHAKLTQVCIDNNTAPPKQHK